jgi:hypothetical protein
VKPERISEHHHHLHPKLQVCLEMLMNCFFHSHRLRLELAQYQRPKQLGLVRI